MLRDNMQFPVNYKRDLGRGQWVAVSKRHGVHIDLVFSNGRKILYTTDKEFIEKNYSYKFNMRTNDRTGSERMLPDGVQKLVICDYRNANDIDVAKIGLGLPEITYHTSVFCYEHDMILERTKNIKKFKESKKHERDGMVKDLGNGYEAICHYGSVNNCMVDIVPKGKPNEKVVEGLNMSWDRYCTGKLAKTTLAETLGLGGKVGKSIPDISKYIGKPVQHKSLGTVIPIRNDGKTVRVLVQGKGMTDVKIKELRI